MEQVILTISNESETTFIETLSFTLEGKDLKQALGFAVRKAYDTLNTQYDAPVVSINGVELSNAEINKVRKGYLDFQIEFGNIRESLFAQLAFTSEESKVAYMRATDRNNIFKNTKKFSNEQVAAQAKQQLRLTRDLTRWVKEDALNSVVPPEVAQRRAALQEAKKQKRIASKK